MQACGYEWFGGKFVVNGRRGLLDGVEQRLRRFAALEWIAAAEKIVGEELVDVVGDGGLTVGVVAFAGETKREERDESNDGDESSGAGGHGGAVCGGDFAEAICGTIRLRFERFVFQIVIEIANERFHRGVSALGVLMHCREAQDVELRPVFAADSPE